MYELRERSLIRRLHRQRLRYVSGHFAARFEILQQFAEEWSFLTVLRDPVERWFSNYFFNRYKRSGHFARSVSLEEYLESSPGRASARMYVRLFGGWHAHADSALCVARAQRTLEQFDVVGLVEQMDLLEHRLGQLFTNGFSVPTRNTNPLAESKRRLQVTPGLRERVRAQCADDILIYEYASQLVQRQAKLAGLDL